MSEDISPYIREDKSAKIQEIISQYESGNQQEKTLTAGEAKRIDLIRRMTNDPDKKEYMLMLNGIIILLSIVSLVHYIMFGGLLPLIFIAVALVFMVIVRKRMATETMNLSKLKNDFDNYLWAGYYLKEMRFTAVRFSFLVFFPLLAIFITDIITGNNTRVTLITAIITAFVLTLIGFSIFFSDDKNTLDSLHSDLESLKYLH